jgi:ElaB/YqjD/DUF883 family membrane-anchored ribosome-binding protein
MSERMSRGYGSAPASHAPSTDRDRPSPTPIEAAREAAIALERETTSLAHTLESLRSAHAANDPRAWIELRSRVDRALVESERTRQRAHSKRGDAASDIRDRVDAADRRMAELELAARELTEAPSGITAVSRETELLTIKSGSGAH